MDLVAAKSRGLTRPWCRIARPLSARRKNQARPSFPAGKLSVAWASQAVRTAGRAGSFFRKRAEHKTTAAPPVSDLRTITHLQGRRDTRLVSDAHAGFVQRERGVAHLGERI